MTDQLPVNEIWPIGTRVYCDFHHRIPATINEVLPDGGFRYVLDEPHHLGPRHGCITEGTAFTREGWGLLSSICERDQWAERQRQKIEWCNEQDRKDAAYRSLR